MGEWLVAPSVDNVITRLRNGGLQSHERRALLAALGHSPDCVAPDHYRKVWQEEREARERAEFQRDAAFAREERDAPRIRHVSEGRRQALARAERAERERDEAHTIIKKLLPDNFRLRETLNRAHSCSEWDDEMGWCEREHGHDGPHERLNGLGVALRWADADADAEPEPCAHESREENGGWAWCPDCRHGWPAESWEPSRAEADPPGEHVHDCGCIDDVEADGSRTRAVVCDDHLEPGDQQQHCYWCGGLLPSCWWDVKPNHECVHACDVGVMRREEYFRAKADAAGGRPREADPQGPSIRTGDASVDGGGDDGRSRAIAAAAMELANTRYLSMIAYQATRVIDAALASGHVRLTDPGEPDISVEAYWAVSEERDRAEARVRELEAVVREARTLIGRHLVDLDVDDTAWAEAEDRLRAALEGGNDG